MEAVSGTKLTLVKWNFLSEWALLVVHTYLQAMFWGIAAISGSVGVSKFDESHRFRVEV